MEYGRKYGIYNEALSKLNEGIVINSDIIDANDLRFLIMGLRGTTDELDEGEQYMAENLNRWYQYKQKNVYSTNDKNAKNRLYSDYAVKKVGNISDNNSILNELMEFVVGDLLEAMLESQDVKVLKTSKYDDIKSGIDYILISKHGAMLAIDLTLSTDLGKIKQKSSKSKAMPMEFNISVGNTKYNINKGKVGLDHMKRIEMERLVLSLEPNLIQKFMMEYVDQIVSFDNPEEINKDIVLDSWEIAKEEYKAGEVDVIEKGIYYGETQERVLHNIERTQKELLSALE